MNKFFMKAICAVSAVCLACCSAVCAFAESGMTAAAEQEEIGTNAAVIKEEGSTNTGSGDADENGTLTAADARTIMRSVTGKGDRISVANGDYNMDDRVTVSDAKMLLRAAAGIAPLSQLNTDNALEMNGMGIFDRAMIANGKSFSVAEYNYYYSSLYMSYAQQSYYYDYYYGSGYGAALTGFDYTVSPAEQYVPADDRQITFAEYFNELAIQTIEQYSYYASEAKAAGAQLDSDDLDYIGNILYQMQQSAEQYDMTVDELLEEQYGSGFNRYVFYNVITDQLFAQKYQTLMNENIAENITDEEIEAQYNTDPTGYNCVSLRAFRLTVTTDEDGTADEQQQQKAAADFMNRVTDEASFIEIAAELDPVNFAKDANSAVPDAAYETIENGVGADAADWAFDTARKAGDKQVFSTGNYIYVLFIVSPAARNETRLPTVRHILITFREDDEGIEEGMTDAYGELLPTKEEAYALAEKYLAEYKRSAKTEESFAALAEKYSEDTASLSGGQSGTEGGLYADMEKGAFVQEFENWAFDAARQPGDTGIIETTYGYHIMYFCKNAEEEEWKSTIRQELAEEKTDDFMSNLVEKYNGCAIFDEESKNAAYLFALDCIEAFI